MTVAIRESATDRLHTFTVPEELEASGPPESRDLARDRVRLMVAGDGEIRHRSFTDLPSRLRSGDLVVFNNSATLPAAVVVDDRLAIHFSTQQPGGLVVVEPRVPSGVASLQLEKARPGRVDLPGGASVDLLAPYPIDPPPVVCGLPQSMPEMPSTNTSRDGVGRSGTTTSTAHTHSIPTRRFLPQCPDRRRWRAPGDHSAIG